MFTWNGAVLIEQELTAVAAGQGQVVTWNYRPGTFTPLTQAEHAFFRDAPQEQVDQRFYAIITDLVGTPAELVSSDGTLAGHQVQTLWGGTTWTSGGAQTPLRFPGQYEDPETGLHYNNQRYYDPVSGSYLTPDPLGLAPSPNPHAYVPNPYALIDPLGLCPAAKGGVRVAAGEGAGSQPASLVRVVGGHESRADLFNEMKARTFESGQEQALVRLGSGGRVIVSGGHTGISGLDNISELIAHTHPYDVMAQGPSPADYTALNQLGQQSSILLEHGQVITFTVNDEGFLKLFPPGG